MPPYAVRCEIEKLEEGSLLEYLHFFVEVPEVIATALIGAGAFKFIKDYDSLRKGILSIAADINTVSIWVFGVFERQFRTTTEKIQLKSEAELEREVQLVATKLAQEAERVAGAARQALRSHPSHPV
jgi:hypothetical protein